MGTRFELLLEGADEVRARPVADAVFEEIQEWHDRLSLFSRSSEVSHINARAGEGWVRASADVFELLLACRDMFERTRGAFDVTVAPLMRRLGLHGECPDVEAPWSVGFDAVDLDEKRRMVRFARPGMAIDPGGIGKGHALDRAREIMEEAGVRDAFLHGGTSAGVAMGSREGGEGWVIGVAGCEESRPEIVLRDEAFCASATHGRVVVERGERRGHVIDPREGRPAGAAEVACVIAGSAREADAWSTALIVLGERPARMADEMTTLMWRGGGAWKIEGARRDRVRVSGEVIETAEAAV